MLAFLVELAHQIFDTADVGAAVTDDQGIGRGHRRQMAVLRYQWSDQRDQLGDRTVLYLNQSGFQLVRRIAAAIGFCLGFGVGHDAGLIALGDHGKAVGGHDREKQLVDLTE